MSSNRLQEMREKSRKRKELLKHSLGRQVVLWKLFMIINFVEVFDGVYETSWILQCCAYL